METNTPYYYSESVRVLGPLMTQAMEKSKAAAIFISENTTQLIHWVREKTPLVIEWVRVNINNHETVTCSYLRCHRWSTLFFAQVYTNTPDSVFQVLAYVRELLLLLHHNYILPALAFIAELLQRAWTNLQESCKSVHWGFNLYYHRWPVWQHVTDFISQTKPHITKDHKPFITYIENMTTGQKVKCLDTLAYRS